MFHKKKIFEIFIHVLDFLLYLHYQNKLNFIYEKKQHLHVR